MKTNGTTLGVLALLLASASHAQDGGAPTRLVCLAKYYAVKAERVDGGWALVLSNGETIPDDDGKTKSFEEKLEHPDVEDVFSIPYRAGPIRPVTTRDDDPGRIRLDQIFKATYGEAADKVDVVDFEFMGQKLKVHRKVVPQFTKVHDALKAAVAKDPKLAPFLEGIGGTFNWRNIAGTDRPSAHSWGVSMDINTRRSHYWRWTKGPMVWKNEIPQAIVDAFESNGFIWGGRWFHYDTMHFEYRPELLDPACYTPAR